MTKPIDFVIYWVDGDDPMHKQKRLYYQSLFKLNDDKNYEQSMGSQRFVQKNELLYCLRSIKQFAPWYRNIFIITDNQIPSFLNSTELHKDKIKIIDHRELFKGNPEYLPTFNSRALTAQLCELEELSDGFIYGNDDFMLSAPVDKSFFFRDGLPVIYADRKAESEIFNKTLFYQGIMNAARLVNRDAREFYIQSHGFVAMNKTRLQSLARKFPMEFRNNKIYKFRHESQFLVEALYMHDCINSHQCVLFDSELMVHFSIELCREGPLDKVRFLLDLLEQGKRKMFCLNDYQALLARMPEIEERLNIICGHPLASENKTTQ